MRSFYLLFTLLFSLPNFAQYTETINSNRPGLSYGAFGVGNQVFQLEAGVSFGNDTHSLRLSDADIFGIDYALRFGLFTDRLEFIFDGRFLGERETILVGGTNREFEASNFERNTFGAKYLIYDPWLKKQNKGPNLYSWKANNSFKWSDLVPAIAVYAGANIAVGEQSPFMPPNTPSISPRLALITQQNYGRWVFVSNFIYDRFTTDFTAFAGIFTLTHSVSQNFSIFGEFQTLIDDYYSDELLRYGAAYLFSRNFQIDAFGLTNFKDTPSRWQFGLGFSYRIDQFHKDELLPTDKIKKNKKFGM